VPKTLHWNQHVADEKKRVDNRSIIDTLPIEVQHMRIGIYARVSTKKQDEMNQLDQLREFIPAQGWKLELEFIDKVSGSGKKVRKAFDEMMVAASQKKFDLLLFWSLDRLSREGIVKTIGYLEQLKGWNVGWRSYTQRFLDTGNQMTNDIVLSVLAAVAQQERITISERTKAGLARAVKEGRKLGRKAVVVDVAKAKAMQKQGLGLRPIAAKLGISVNTLRGAL
jgi:DNA invertase Pin-like site-specific DNA recombinase